MAFKLFLPSFYQKNFRTIKRVFLIWMNLYPVVLIVVFTYFAITLERITMPESRIIDYLLIYPFWIFFILSVQVFLYFIIIDILKLLLFPLYRKHKKQILRIQSAIVLVLTAFFLIYVPTRIIYDYNGVSVRTIDYEKENLPDDLNNFYIAFISDLQADHYTDEGRLSNFIEIVNSLNPDLVLIAGDFITTGPKYISISANLVGKLNAKHGVYSCIGDHDNWAYRGDISKSLTEIKKALKENNIEFVDNSQRVFRIGHAALEVTFATYTYSGRIPRSMLDSLVINGSGDFKIFLTHQPRQHLIDAASENNYDLFLAGHTHGGQISFLFPFIQLTPTLFETNYLHGDFWFDDMLMIVNRGLGMSLAPLRYNSTPEITLIKIFDE
ncbi:MAG: metallophosphoesterase [Ignavibacterium sp.]|nr:MAG: metallophosphoesterase [Ignavibacterium sp.]